ncbi:DmsC/YnfH family molybdoenzyme membrane anchor subunit [Pelagibius sp. Alg239-R121]|uniref:dimethyl sulfoxide reductase anchor subunit family protein n=1 Tax=Pelagibius sp. Alg239-R121 TaxID=2993448 RepID=UPI0024A64721|nr:DmsC/YnfH family molybdoenzyme membrane anchor subunit [Pelagibius sp. Alg239-R121]
MHPASSIIVFTTFSGMGFGLIAMLGLGAAPSDGTAGFVTCALAFILTSVGLASSTFHLGHPERAWRALSQWRSSWLSREGALAAVTLGLFAIYAVLWIFADDRVAPIGVLLTVLSIVTVYATAMIYGSLKTVPRWQTGLTPLCYLLFAAAGGALLAAALSSLLGAFSETAVLTALGLMVVAWVAKFVWWGRADRTTLGSNGSSPETATGLGHIGKVRLLEAPHSSPNYLMKEMVYRVGRKHARKLRLLAVALGGAVPVLGLLAAIALDGGAFFLVVAVLSHLIGMLAERWLFFAEAEHSVSLYYGHR